MTTKHTPGPWRLDIAARSAGFAVVASRPKASGGTNRVCSTIPANRTPDAFEEAKANARLIAAAPEMLAALKDAIGALEFCRDYHSDLGNEDQDFAQGKLEAAITAIAKAEART